MADVRNNGRTLLHNMAHEGNTEEVALLLAKGSDVFAADFQGRTPLHEAAWAGDTESVTLLLNRGASIDASDVFGRTPLHEAASEGYVETTAMLLNRGADHRLCDKFGKTALHMAMTRKHEEIVKTLCAWETDAQARTISRSRQQVATGARRQEEPARQEANVQKKDPARKDGFDVAAILRGMRDWS